MQNDVQIAAGTDMFSQAKNQSVLDGRTAAAMGPYNGPSPYTRASYDDRQHTTFSDSDIRTKTGSEGDSHSVTLGNVGHGRNYHLTESGGVKSPMVPIVACEEEDYYGNGSHDSHIHSASPRRMSPRLLSPAASQPRLDTYGNAHHRSVSSPHSQFSYDPRRSVSGPVVSHESTQSAGGASIRLSRYDLSSSHITPHLGAHANSLMPRVKTIELYRKNAKKYNDPEIEYQLAQYMIQTALLKNSSDLDAEAAAGEEKVKRGLLKEALTLLRKLSERGYASAQYLLGDMYSTQAIDGKADLNKSFSYFLLAAKHGHAESAYRAALCLQEGWGTSRDPVKALRYYTSAASKNQPGALLRLGIAYFYGHLGLQDTSTNKVSGVKWLTRAVNTANEIYNQAPYELGKIYETGYKDIVFKDIPYTVKLFTRSAELNYIPAAVRLGSAFEKGELGCPQDAALSIHYYTIAALGNDPNAQLSMCAWYMVGAGPQFPRNEDEAFEWALRAAHNGLPKAQFTVGLFYENGIGVNRDIFQSTSWYNKAAANGDERAIKRLRNSDNETSKQKKDCKPM